MGGGYFLEGYSTRLDMLTGYQIAVKKSWHKLNDSNSQSYIESFITCVEGILVKCYYRITRKMLTN